MYALRVIYDNLGEYLKAVGCYKSFSKALTGEHDNFAHALAHCSIGVSYFMLGAAYSEKARYHFQEMTVVADVYGKFVAHSNLGLLSLYTGDGESAVNYHQHAYKYAVDMGSVPAQCVASGNLGLTAFANKDFGSAKMCMVRCMKLARSLRAGKTEGMVTALLGDIAQAEGDYQAARELFHTTRSMAHSQGLQSDSNSARVNEGIANAHRDMEARMKDLAAVMTY